ncbi:MAG: hypothetical protein OXK79_13195 [Chloroflexota bacterium]|nr:hypothetical protein [Chloroflexota bacterium]
MANENVRHDYSGRPIPSFDELDSDNPGGMTDNCSRKPLSYEK